jgi:formylglycine-generating enzyme
MKTLTAVLVIILLLLFASTAEGREGLPAGREMARIPAGSILPLYSQRAERVSIEAFRLDRHPVTRADYLEFVKAVPRWRKGDIRPLFAGPGYLADWPSPLSFGAPSLRDTPVTGVSWFAAKAYCEWEGKRLPTVEEWEYVASASETSRNASGDPAFIQRLLGLHSARRPNAPIGSGFRNAFGVSDMHGLVQEWALDFNSAMVTDDSRRKGSHNRDLFCAAGVISSNDPSNYPAFLRYAFRAGLEGRTTVGNLGFRCAGSI